VLFNNTFIIYIVTSFDLFAYTAGLILSYCAIT